MTMGGAFFMGIACLAAVTFYLAGPESDAASAADARSLRAIKVIVFWSGLVCWVLGALMLAYGD